VWVCTAALAILDRLDVIDVSTLGWWLAERQLPNGGLNGRPEKLEDVRYTIVLSSLVLLTDVMWELGMLQSMGALLPGDSEQAHVDRRTSAHALHPLGSGVLLSPSGV
jgi:hypothetical protein